MNSLIEGTLAIGDIKTEIDRNTQITTRHIFSVMLKYYPILLKSGTETFSFKIR